MTLITRDAVINFSEVPTALEECRDGDLIEITCKSSVTLENSRVIKTTKVLMIFKAVTQTVRQGEMWETSVLHSVPAFKENYEETIGYNRLIVNEINVLPNRHSFFISKIVIVAENYVEQHKEDAKKLRITLGTTLPPVLLDIVCAYHCTLYSRATQQKKCIIA